MSGSLFIFCLVLFTVTVYFLTLYPPPKPTPLHIEKTYVINLESSTDRLAKFKKQLKPFNIPFERWNAVNGREIPKKQFREMGVAHWAIQDFTKKRQGELGALFSHLLLWKYIAKQDYSSNAGVLIFEDDIILAPNFNEHLDKILQKIPSDWDMIVLGYGHEKYFAEPEGAIRKIKRFTGCYAYIVNPASLGKIMPYFSLPGEPVDTILEDLTSRSLITIYAPYNRIVETGNEKSTICP